MLSTQDFAHEVWLSLENIRERLAVLETEARHTRGHLERLEGRTDYGQAADAGAAPRSASRPRGEAGTNSGSDPGSDSGASINIRISRRTLGSLGGGGVIGGGLLAAVVGAGRALGWW